MFFNGISAILSFSAGIYWYRVGNNFWMWAWLIVALFSVLGAATGYIKQKRLRQMATEYQAFIGSGWSIRKIE